MTEAPSCGRTLGLPRGQISPKTPVFTSVTKDSNVLEEMVRNEPSVHFESRTGTVPCVLTKFVATSTHAPPLLLYDDLNQLGDSVITWCPFATL